MEDPETGSYLIHVVAENGEVLSISSTNVDMSDYQPKLAENLKTKNKYIVESLNEMNEGIKKQTDVIGIDDNNNGIGLGGEPSTISEFIGDTYISYLKSVGSLENLVTDDKTAFTSAINEINDKVGSISDITSLVQKDSMINSINALHSSAKITPGTIIMYGGSTAPEGFLVCDGSAVSPSDYSDLYDVIGSTYGLTADGNFKVPNLKGFAVIGSYGASNLGDTTGHKKITLSTNHIPSHRHIYTGTHKHGDGVNQYTNDNSFSIPRSMSGNGRSGSTHDSAVHNSQNGWHYHPDFTSGSETHKHTGYNNEGGEAHNNLMPYIVLNYIIKY
jgi:microcystin-dependent protein